MSKRTVRNSRRKTSRRSTRGRSRRKTRVRSRRKTRMRSRRDNYKRIYKSRNKRRTVVKSRLNRKSLKKNKRTKKSKIKHGGGWLSGALSWLAERSLGDSHRVEREPGAAWREEREYLIRELADKANDEQAEKCARLKILDDCNPWRVAAEEHQRLLGRDPALGHEAAAAGLRHDAHDLAVHRVRGALQVAVVVAQELLQLAVEGEGVDAGAGAHIIAALRFESVFDCRARVSPPTRTWACVWGSPLGSPLRAATLPKRYETGISAAAALQNRAWCEAKQLLCSRRQCNASPSAHKGLNPQAEQLGACDTRVQGSCIIKNSGIAELDLLQQRPAREQQVARRPAHVEDGPVRR